MGTLPIQSKILISLIKILLLIISALAAYFLLIQKSIVLGATVENRIRLVSSSNLRQSLQKYFFIPGSNSFLVISFTNTSPTEKPKITQSSEDNTQKLASCTWQTYANNFVGKLTVFVDKNLAANQETDVKFNRLLTYCFIRMAQENDATFTLEAISSQLRELTKNFSNAENLIVTYQ